ncbi:protein disulfide-isomerase a6 [Anaeramoeba flamelloides]|uniref:Protein disulfide-isomerase a6 n=1 Tax=Anaeramoeba flamelloides TaxID=1746091 RepID=A0AAV7YAV8_9EUKA|nr:protein disulfide-isomerase a6 [Anaeramoeba flamelloides]
MKNFQTTLLIFFSIFLVSQCGVIELTESNYNTEVLLNKESDWLIKFYANWCPHCQNMKEAFERASNAQDGIVKYGGVECPSENSVCEKEGIRGYPTIRFRSQKGFWIDYNQDRSEKSFKEFSNKYAHRSYNKIADTQLLNKYSDYCISFIIYVPSKSDDSLNEQIETHLQTLSKESPTLFTFVHLDLDLLKPSINKFDEKIQLFIKDETNDGPPLLISFQSDSLELYNGPFDDLTIIDDWIKSKSVQKIQNFNDLDLQELKAQSKFAVVSLVDLEVSSTLLLRGDMMAIQEKNRDKFNNFVFSWINIDHNNQNEFQKKYRIKKKNLPTLIVIDFEKDSFWNLDQINGDKNDNKDTIQQLLTKVENNEIENYQINQKTPFVHFFSDTWFWFVILLALLGYLYIKFVKPMMKKRRVIH